MTQDWSAYWHKPDNCRWSALDEHVLEVVAGAIGWGPDRTMLEIGGGRGEHSKRLWKMGRCGKAMIYDVSPDARLLAERNGLPVKKRLVDADIVWSYGLCEHFEGVERQVMIDRHYACASELVAIVVPAKSRTRHRPWPEVPWQCGFTVSELKERMERPGWVVDVVAFAPLYSIRHIPEAVYGPLTTLVKHVLPGNLLIGTARKEAADADTS